MKAITKRLRLLRTEKGLTQRDAALRAGMPIGRYWEIENGYRSPGDEDLGRLGLAFGIPANEVLDAESASVEWTSA